ncbi:MAG TPA: VWA domain-containing protein [Bryobacteraceae bacterium]|nr:VWA domain-containing protein [Bryobacteraceae bacterium]
MSGITQEKDTPIKVDVDLVNVLATVYDKRGVLVTDLKQEEFEIREDGKPQEIKYFARETSLPLTIALLLDVSGSVRRFIDAEKETAARFLQEILRPQDRALLMGFSSTIVLWQNFTASPVLLRANLEQLHPIPFRGIPLDGSPMPATLLYDAVYATAVDELEGISGRKVMVIISDGLDNGSTLHLDDAVRAVQSRNTVVYGICFTNGFSGCSFLKNIAEPTGGRMFELGTKAPLSKIFQTIQDELRSQYSLGYVPVNRAHDGTFRKLQIRVLRKDLKVDVRKGYYAYAEH